MSHFSSVLQVFIRTLMVKLNFHWYLSLQFYPTCEIGKHFIHAKITRFTVVVFPDITGRVNLA